MTKEEIPILRAESLSVEGKQEGISQIQGKILEDRLIRLEQDCQRDRELMTLFRKDTISALEEMGNIMSTIKDIVAGVITNMEHSGRDSEYDYGGIHRESKDVLGKLQGKVMGTDDCAKLAHHMK